MRATARWAATTQRRVRADEGNMRSMSAGLPAAPEVRDSLMDALHHEDHQGLWEVVWTLNTQCPEVPLADKLALARAVVFDLLKSGQIELRKIAWPEHDGPPLTAEQRARLHYDDAPWYDPESSADLLVQVNSA